MKEDESLDQIDNEKIETSSQTKLKNVKEKFQLGIMIMICRPI